jgi:hypothetical protein
MGSPERAQLIVKRASVRARIARLEQGGAKLIWRLTRGGHTVARGTTARTPSGRATIRLPNERSLPRGAYKLLIAGSDESATIVIR